MLQKTAELEALYPLRMASFIKCHTVPVPNEFQNCIVVGQISLFACHSELGILVTPAIPFQQLLAEIHRKLLLKCSRGGNFL